MPPPPPDITYIETSDSHGADDINDETLPSIGLGARISQKIEKARKGYEQLVHAIIRPPRAKYTLEQLGPTDFTFLNQTFHREDIELLSSNITQNQSNDNNVNGGVPTCSFLKIQASIWTRVVNDDSANAHGQIIPKKKKNAFVVYLHGNASARVEVVPSLSFLLAKVGVFGVVGMDFTGSGQSDGDYVSLGYYERVDLDCMLQYLQRVYAGPNGDELEIVLWGRSMGASTVLMPSKIDSSKKTSSSIEKQKYYDDEGRLISARSASDNDHTNQLNSESGATKPENTSIIKGLICDSPFASLPILCEELVERARSQGVVVPGVIVSAAIAMIARSVRLLANFNIRDIAPIDHVSKIETPALFIVGADDDFINPRHSELLIERYKTGVTTNLFMVPDCGHNDARPRIVYEGIEEFCKQRLSISTDDDSLDIPSSMLSSIHRNSPWAYRNTAHFQAHEQITTKRPFTPPPAEEFELGMTKNRQDDIQHKIGLVLGGQGEESDQEDTKTVTANNY